MQQQDSKAGEVGFSYSCISSFLCSVNGFVGSSGGSNLGKIAPPKTPPPLPPQGNSLAASSRKADLRVVIPQSKGMMLVCQFVGFYIYDLNNVLEKVENDDLCFCILLKNAYVDL